MKCLLWQLIASENGNTDDKIYLVYCQKKNLGTRYTTICYTRKKKKKKTRKLTLCNRNCSVTMISFPSEIPNLDWM